MDLNPSFSVLMPAFNSRATIARALRSALGQTLPPQEIVVVDDGSTDGTAGLVQSEFGDRVTLIRQSNAGPSAARNRAARHAAAPWLAFLDSDDEWLPEKLERQARHIAAHPESVLCATGYLTRREDGSEFPCPLEAGMSRQAILEALSLKTFFLLSTVAIRRQEFLALDGFLERLHCSEDRDLWTRVAVSHPVTTMPDLLTRKYELSTSLSSDPQKTLRDGRIANARIFQLLTEANALENPASARRKAEALLHISVAHLHQQRAERLPTLLAVLRSIAADPFAPLPDWRRRLGTLRHTLLP